MRRTMMGCAVVALVFTTAACDEKLSDIAGPTPDLSPSLASIQRDIFSAADRSGRAGCTGCHTDQGRTPAANLNLAGANTFQQLVGRASPGKPGAILVIPGDPDGSYLVQKLEGAAGIVGQRMPRTGGPYLTPGQMTIIRRWIQVGAPNN